MRTMLGLAFLLGALILSPARVLAAEEAHEGHSLEQVVVETVHTPAGHAALAAHYRAKAAEARADASAHEKMAKAYATQKRGATDKMGQHCKKVSANSKATAAEYDSLAQLHEAESKQAK